MAISAPETVSRRLLTPGRLVTTLLLVGLLTSLYLTARSLEQGSVLGGDFLVLLLVDLLALVVLGAAILSNLAQLIGARRREALGARLTTRLLLMFVVLALVPAGILFFFSLQFINRGVDSWFHVEVERALDEALDIAHFYLDRREEALLAKSREVAEHLGELGSLPPQVLLPGLRRDADVDQVALFAANGNLLASSSAEPDARLPRAPSRQQLLQALNGRAFTLVLPEEESGPWRVAAFVPVFRVAAENRVLRVVDGVASEVAGHSRAIQTAAETYERLALERGPLKTSFILTLTLVLLLTIFVATWLSFRLADRFTAPIRALARGTRAVARGEYGRQLPVPSHDEVGVLVRSFNAMTRRLADAHEKVRISQAELQSRQAYLQTILDSLSAGVITLNSLGEVETANPAAREILGLAPDGETGGSFESLVRAHPHTRPLHDAFIRLKARSPGGITEEVALTEPQRGPVTLLLRGTPLAPVTDGGKPGFVLVFDDITELSRAQRASAWGEVARRIAHEIKNPLTPIQLSAERLRRRYLPRLGEEGAALDRATTTIIQQVESLRDMVDAFSAYARQPGTRAVPGDLNALVRQAVTLYQGEDRGIRVVTELDPDLPRVLVDGPRMSQVLGNVLQNAWSALEEAREGGRIVVRSGILPDPERAVFLEVEDDGPGFPAELLERVFDPYVTSKDHGTGLGLAIVRKIVEEHEGRIHAENPPGSGARVRIVLALAGESEEPSMESEGQTHE
ncbi:sensor histidine kinase [Thiohalorhabdus sp. Cl-TMA]|uniref:histidine kinase n=1 Tax=Thiohalorhabdus methylotrophus TaxID=3242694 RepID=A0ABV4TQG7_9GAMM